MCTIPVSEHMYSSKISMDLTCSAYGLGYLNQMAGHMSTHLLVPKAACAKAQGYSTDVANPRGISARSLGYLAGGREHEATKPPLWGTHDFGRGRG